MCDPFATILSLARENFLPLAHEHLLPLLKEAVDMVRGVPNDKIADMKHELQIIEKFIHQADKMADDAEEDDQSDVTREKIKKLIQAFYGIQDVIDEYIIREEQQLSDPGCVAGVSDSVKSKILRLQITRGIHHIKSQINEIKATSSEKDHEGSSHSSTNPNATSMQSLRMAPFYMAEADVVGFEKPRDILVNWLVEGRKQLTVVSVVAMGGQGKTTVAKKVFDSKEVVKHFDCRVWMTVSQPYNIEELLRDMLTELCEQKKVNPPQCIHEMNQKSLVDEVRNYLQEKRYVVVFDDVWNPDFWDDIKFAMIDINKGCRILITTRTMDVATACRTSSFVKIHELKSLNDEQSLELFNKKAFYDLDGCCPENLINISRKIVEKCDGLPLAIVVMGALLSSKSRDVSQWNRFSTNLNLELSKNSMIKSILGLSYHELPYNLKSCFLYFGLYHEDCIVPSRILIKQWMAEGFVKEDRGMTLEEVAEGYLTELIRRSLVQAISISIDGRVNNCRVHDLVHAMILQKCEDLKFCKNVCEDKPSSLTGMVRRFSLATSCDNSMASVENCSHVRSLIAYEPKTLSESFIKRIPTKYRRLKVLHLHNDHLVEVPNDLGSLTHLNYFRFGTRTSRRKFSLPKSIGMLGNLETLDLSNATFTDLPKEICKLKKLRHFIGFNMSLIELKDDIGGMTSLQTLSTVRLDDYEDESDTRVVELIKELGKLQQLRELGLVNVKGKYISAICSSINEMQQLEKLYIRQSGYTFIDIHLNSPPPMLRIVTLQLMLKRFPKWISKLENLVKLTVNLTYSQLDYVIKLLKGMPTLLTLEISRCGNEERLERLLHFQNGWFKNLKELSVKSFHALNCILIDQGALGSVKQLRLYSLPRIKTLPIGIQHLQKLEFLILVDMSMEFKANLIPDAGKEHWIFKQVPFVEIHEN